MIPQDPAKHQGPSSSSRRRKRGTGHELRGVVIRVATDLLARSGDVDALTMRDVAADAGVTAPSVYRHFPDKQALVRAVITERFADFTAVLNQAAEGREHPVARLEAMSRAYVSAGLEQPGHYRVLFSAANAGPAGLGLPEGTGHPGAAAFQVLVDAVAGCLAERASSPAAMTLATGLWASLHGIVDLRITKPEMDWPDTELLVDHALGAIRSAAG
ncbi:TetR/AcrR family transcriptional regulator [Arthrobacter castelli]|uniref:TetR/AcrR family transcriptional regulator n=1 Tax=Arthrobacter castelli TaxID=271431 RepID=UPI000420E950|nr:TetR/AcrR family transcriptional regulator [Arthrobacter castelli]